MKLLNKTSTYYILFALPVFAICSVMLYLFISSEIRDTVDEALWKEKISFEQQFKSGKINKQWQENFTLNSTDQVISNSETNTTFSDTSMYDVFEEEILPYRMLKTIVSDGKQNYLFCIYKSTMESDDLIESILYPVLFLFVFLLIGFFLINWYIAKKLWKPFYTTLHQLSDFKIGTSNIPFEQTSIHEFSELNAVLTSMTKKLQADFVHQKEFIENASHEIQTPLAVIKSKIELLIQSTTLSASDMQIIQAVYTAANKLSSLNKALLLLSKIENDQFKQEEQIDIQHQLDKTVLHLEDLIALKNITVTKTYLNKIECAIHPILADILVSNLIQNAIRHNIENGSINITLKNKSLIISNTSNSTISNTEELFQRFRKNEASSESIGLGLAIVKEICAKFNITIRYTCIDKMHTIELLFQ